MSFSPMLDMLAENRWEEYQPLMGRFGAWPLFPLVEERLRTLDHTALFESRVHGLGHIERTILHGGLCAMEEGISPEDTALLMDACAYHDVGRVNDWLDAEHGARSALRLEGLTGRTGQELILLQAAVAAHSRADAVLDVVLEEYHPADMERCRLLALLLKDADGLDRVRICDLDVRFLRLPTSPSRAAFAAWLFQRYRQVSGDDWEPRCWKKGKSPFYGNRV